MQAPAQQQSAPGTAGADTAIPAVGSTKPEAQMPGHSNAEAMEIEEGCKGCGPAFASCLVPK